jgi:Xaa-Pro aminopeptidase
MEEEQIESILITKPENRRYISGFTGSAGTVFITQERAYLITDFRYKEQAANQCEGFEVLITSPEKSIYEIISAFGLSQMGYEDTT